MDFARPLDYLAVGHITHDLTDTGWVMGGTAAYAAALAGALGCRTAILTSSADTHWGDDLPGIEVVNVPAPQTTVFENVYTPEGRRQTIHSVAGRLTAADVPESLRRPSIVHLGPVADEIDPAMPGMFTNSLIGLTPQGWMRRWDAEGRVYADSWERAAEIIPLAAAMVLGDEDLNNKGTLEVYLRYAHLLALTHGERGCTVFYRGESRHFSGLPVEAVETTGAGDIFAAAYFVRLHQTGGDPWESARFANRIAAISTTRRGLWAKVEAIRRALLIENPETS